MKNKFVTIAGIQSAVSSDLKTNLIKTAKQVEKAARMGAKIICLQELYRTHYFPQYPRAKKNKFSETTTGQSVKIFSAIAKKYKVVIIVPIFEKDKRGNYYNSDVVINTEGKLLPTYKKSIFTKTPFSMKKIISKMGIEATRFIKPDKLLSRC